MIIIGGILMKKKRLKVIIELICLGLVIFIQPIVNALSFLTEDDQLEVKNQLLISENNNLINELKSVYEIYDLKYENISFIYGKVTLRDIFNFYDEITINIGEADGVKVGSAVVGKGGLLGIVNKVYTNSSIVKLITNKSLNIAVKVNEGYGNFNDFVVKDVDQHLKVDVGDKVYTSGLTDLYGGIYVGTVKEIISDDLEIAKKLIIENDLRVKEINYVGVIVK